MALVRVIHLEPSVTEADTFLGVLLTDLRVREIGNLLGIVRVGFLAILGLAILRLFLVTKLYVLAGVVLIFGLVTALVTCLAGARAGSLVTAGFNGCSTKFLGLAILAVAA